MWAATSKNHGQCGKTCWKKAKKQKQKSPTCNCFAILCIFETSRLHNEAASP